MYVKQKIQTTNFHVVKCKASDVNIANIVNFV